MNNTIIVMHEKLGMGEKDSGYFTSLTVAINSVEWRCALKRFNGRNSNPNKNCLRVAKVEYGEEKFVEMIKTPIVGEITKDINTIYVLEEIDDLNNPIIRKKYFVHYEDAFKDPTWDNWRRGITKFKYQFKSHYTGHYIDIINNKSIQVRPLKIRSNIFIEFYEDID